MQEDTALPVAIPGSGNPPLVLTDTRREDRKPMTQEELLRAVERHMMEKEYYPLELTRGEPSGELKKLIDKHMREAKEVARAYRGLVNKIRNYIVNGMYREALQVLEADPDFVKYRHHPKFKALHDEVKKRQAGAQRREKEGVPNPARATDAAGQTDGRSDG